MKEKSSDDEETISVLVVEDEAIISRDISDTLADLGYHVVGQADNGKDALEIATRRRPDVILMDMVLKGELSGVETASLLSAMDMPVIYLTSYSDDETIRKAKLTRPYGYITKPFTEKDLRTNIEIAHHEHRIKKELDSNRKILDSIFSTAPEALVVYDYSTDRVVMSNRKTFLGMDIEGFLHSLFSSDPVFELEEGSDVGCIDDLKSIAPGSTAQSFFRYSRESAGTEWFLLRGRAYQADEEGNDTRLTISLSRQTDLIKAQKMKRENEALKMRYALSKVMTDLIPILMVNSGARKNEAFYRELSGRVDDILYDSFFGRYDDSRDFWENLTSMITAFGGKAEYDKEAERVALRILRCPWSDSVNPVKCKIMKGMMERFALKEGVNGRWAHEESLAKGDERCLFVIEMEPSQS